MRSRAARLTIGTLALLAIGGAAFFLIQSEKHILEQRAAVRAFDLHSREAADALADIRASQQAYVAAGQGVEFWMPKVDATLDTATRIVAALRPTAMSPEASSAMSDAAQTVSEFGSVDKRVRDYIAAGQPVMAADVVFTEGGQAVLSAARQVERARLAEHQALDRSEAAQRTQEATGLAGAAALAALAIALLVLPVRVPNSSIVDDGSSRQAGDGLSLREPMPRMETSPAPAREAPILKAAGELSTDFGRVKDLDEMTALLARAADLMDASGLVVWVGSSAGADMRPVLAHGYTAQTLARMPTVPRSGDNAAAAAYRTGKLRIVLARPGSSNGAVVAPLLSAEGCIGALSAEIRGGGETSDIVQALSTIFAAQLAGIVVAPPAAAESRAAASS